jgi:hypothetical protein
MPTHKGFGMVRRRILLAPKAHQWSWAGKKFIGAGGAVSVDKHYRLAKERGDKEVLASYGELRSSASGPKTLYWPNEQLTDEDVYAIKSFGEADFLFTHDCSDYTPFKGRLKPDIDSQMHRKRIDTVLAATTPKFHFHGHMHTKYDWENPYPHGYTPFDEDYDGRVTRTIGLEAFTDFNSWGVLDVEDEQWFWPTELYAALDARAERKAERTGIKPD